MCKLKNQYTDLSKPPESGILNSMTPSLPLDLRKTSSIDLNISRPVGV